MKGADALDPIQMGSQQEPDMGCVLAPPEAGHLQEALVPADGTRKKLLSILIGGHPSSQAQLCTGIRLSGRRAQARVISEASR